MFLVIDVIWLHAFFYSNINCLSEHFKTLFKYFIDACYRLSLVEEAKVEIEIELMFWVNQERPAIVRCPTGYAVKLYGIQLHHLLVDLGQWLEIRVLQQFLEGALIGLLDLLSVVGLIGLGFQR